MESDFSRPFVQDGSFGPAGSQTDPDDVAFQEALAEHAERAQVAALLALPRASFASDPDEAGSGGGFSNVTGDGPA